MQVPSWTYTYVDIPNLDKIQQELASEPMMALAKESVPEDRLYDFVYLKRDQVEQYIPETLKFFSSVGLGQKWFYMAYVIVRKSSLMPIHVDYVNPEDGCFALNLPVKNTKDSYTVFYEVQGKMEDGVKVVDNKITYGTFTEDQVIKEISRCDANRPYWMNTSIAHRPEVLHENERIICSIRFRPEIFEWFDKKYPELK